MSTHFVKLDESKISMVLMPAPFTLRIPISFVRFSATKADRCKKAQARNKYGNNGKEDKHIACLRFHYHTAVDTPGQKRSIDMENHP